jgi:glycerol-3-phosphate acyltransferase PlsY
MDDTILLKISVILISYLIGSIPTALIISRWRKGVDIRRVGDGNMGARNTFRSLGRKLGVIVALADILKGSFSILITRGFGLDLNWQCISGAAVIAGHDFPIFAHFRGGQGLATTYGTMLVMFPVISLIGFVIYGLVFIISRNSNISASIGFGTIAFYLWWLQMPLILLVYTLFTLIFIPFKKLLDSNRVRSGAGNPMNCSR